MKASVHANVTSYETKVDDPARPLTRRTSGSLCSRFPSVVYSTRMLVPYFLMCLLVLLMSHVECLKVLHWDHPCFCCM